MTDTGGTAPFIPDTNLLERLFLEERRGTRIIPHAFGERPVKLGRETSLVVIHYGFRNMRMTAERGHDPTEPFAAQAIGPAVC